ncbi:LysR family transcriptional regulator [Paractinoplanes maris]|uniref:LysR family transcriptional regulator n=1 Tax=Paractinoplanes maris TaxID=1734446 RepID=UPI00202123DA|nr:LysR family transcriptional regulator [Actinoplanes maris]
MDLIASCAAFVAVSRHASFTQGAAAAGIPQPVASRRIAALERHLGALVLERSSRTVVLTPFGRDMLPMAQRLVDLADAMRDNADRARLRVFDLAVPVSCPALALARLIADGRHHGLYFDVVPAEPSQRSDLVRAREVHAAITAVPPGDGTWQVPVGLAGNDQADTAMFLEELRPARTAGSAPRRVWIQPEDVVPHVLDRMVRLGNAVGLQRSQITTARTVPAAVSRAISGADLLLCSRREAEAWGLGWRPVGEEPFSRGYTITSADKEDGRKVRALLSDAIADCLGA